MVLFRKDYGQPGGIPLPDRPLFSDSKHCVHRPQTGIAMGKMTDLGLSKTSVETSAFVP